MTDFRVAEIFGPTIQGEGRHVGKPAIFVRLGGCDDRCLWCDSGHAVDSKKVLALPVMNEKEIVRRVTEISEDVLTVVITGGNPALWDLSSLIHSLHAAGYFVHLETQGTIYRDWFKSLDALVISPKPPSAGPANSKWERVANLYQKHMDQKDFPEDTILKIVIFHHDDLDFAARFANRVSSGVYLSIGTVKDEANERLLARYHRIIGQVVVREDLVHRVVSILPQMHVLVWGHQLGV